jgi:hypothetical protein
MSADAAWLSTLKAQPWFSGVASVFAAKQVAAPLWESTLYIEDASLNPAAHTLDHHADGTPAGYSSGLFQLNENGLGAGVLPAIAFDPVANATIAASAMAKRIAVEGTSSADYVTQLRSIERAGWNGSTDQDAARQGALADVTASTTSEAPVTFWEILNALNPFTYKIWQQLPPIPGVPGTGTPQANQPTPGPGVTDPAKAGVTSDQYQPVIDAAKAIALEIGIGAVFVALIAGGFAIAAAPE